MTTIFTTDTSNSILCKVAAYTVLTTSHIPWNWANFSLLKVKQVNLKNDAVLPGSFSSIRPSNLNLIYQTTIDTNGGCQFEFFTICTISMIFAFGGGAGQGRRGGSQVSYQLFFKLRLSLSSMESECSSSQIYEILILNCHRTFKFCLWKYVLITFKIIIIFVVLI